MAEELTEYTLICLENAVAKGAETNAEMAEALGWSQSKFESIKHGKRVNGEEESTRTYEAIKRGKSRRKDVFLALAENSLRKLIAGYEYDEITTEVTETEKGAFTKTKTVRKHIKPDTASVIYTLTDSGNWKNGYSESKDQPHELKIGFSEDES